MAMCAADACEGVRVQEGSKRQAYPLPAAQPPAESAVVIAAPLNLPVKMLLHTSMQEHGGCGTVQYRYCV